MLAIDAFWGAIGNRTRVGKQDLLIPFSFHAVRRNGRWRKGREFKQFRKRHGAALNGVKELCSQWPDGVSKGLGERLTQFLARGRDRMFFRERENSDFKQLRTIGRAKSA